MKGFTGTQRHVEKFDQNTINRFKATKGLTTELKKDRIKAVDEKRSALFANTGKLLLQQARIEKQEEKLHPKQAGSEISIESEVRGLSNFQKPVWNPRTEEMIKKQRENRRDRHIKTNIDFENWIEKLNIDIEEGYVDIKKEIVEYFKFSDIEIEEYFNSMSDDYLLSREKDILEEMKTMIDEHEQKRTDKVFGLDKKLDNQENERDQNLKYFCNNLQTQLIDIAFILEPEVKELVQKKSVLFEQQVKDNLEQNQKYVEQINEKQKETFKKFEEMRQDVEKRWKNLRHDEALELFLEDIKQMEYVNPDERKDLYIDWKIKTKDIYDKRVNFLRKLSGCEMEFLSKQIVDKWLEDVKNFNDKAQEVYDACFNDLMQESERANKNAQERYDMLKERLEYVNHIEGEELQQLLDEKCGVIVKKLHEDARQLMMDAIKYVEENDLKTNELCLNFGKFFAKIGKKNDEHKINQKKSNFDYQIMQAQLEDQNDENIEKLNEEFEEIKVELKMALHHPKLDEILDKSFQQIDKIEDEYRDVHTKKEELVSKHPDMVNDLFLNYEKNQVVFFELLDIEKKEEIEQRNLQRAEAKVAKIMEKEEKQKQLEEEKAAAELASKKGGKKPPAKKVDPKKQQAEFEQRQKELLEEVGVEPVELFETPMQQQFVIAYTVEEIAKKFYEIKEDEEDEEDEEAKKKKEQEEQERQEKERLEKEKQEQEALEAQKKGKKGSIPKAKQPEVPPVQDEEKPQEEEDDDEKPPVPVDFISDPPVDPEGNEILDKNVVVQLDFVIDILQNCQQKLFVYIGLKLSEAQEESKIQDNDWIENSILILDERLKAHYPLKGKVEVDIFQVRSAQITNHKKRYERHARATIDKIDLQTEHFNYLLETGLENTIEYENNQKQCIERLATGHTLAKLQGILNSARENSFKFQQRIDDNIEDVRLLSNEEVQFLLDKNKEFIKESVLFENGGEYAQEEIDWYQTMLNEIDQQLEEQKVKRNQRVQEISEHMANKNKDWLVEFEKQYVLTIEELSAKDGTGKKFGRPRRLAQEKTREEMNKCEKSQETILNFLDQLGQLFEQYQSDKTKPEIYLQQESVFAQEVTSVLMALRACMGRYAKHIEAIKPDSKSTEMRRISYSEDQWDLNLPAEMVEEDDKKKDIELEHLGPLYYQKDEKTFIEQMNEIEKIVIAEAQKLYVGDKAKFLTGNDKMPDYLRTYLENMKKKAQDFKIQCIRDLRNFYEELSDLTPKISEMIIQSVNLRFLVQLNKESNNINFQFQKIKEQNIELKEKHMFQLRPNMSNPCIKEELEELLKREDDRFTKYVNDIQQYKELQLDIEFNQSNKFFKALLHHFEFLLTYYDSLILWEDFVKLPGDEDIQKKHENIKVLTRMQQQGSVIDTSSERSISKEWPGVLVDMFKVGEKKIEYELTQVQEEDPKKKAADKGKGKKDAKKDAKKQPQQQQQQQQEQQENEDKKTKEIKSYKTFRQKSAAHFKNHALQSFKERFDEVIGQKTKYYEEQLYLEQKFQFKWNQTRKQLEDASKV